jgi:GT2 family glycosyltransferase
MRYLSISSAMAIRKDATTDGNFSRELLVRFDCEDNALIGRHQLSQAGTLLEAGGNDPWLLLKPQRRLRRGWYRIDLKAEFDGQAEPRLYFNFGHGFQERFACPLHRVDDGFSAIVRAYKPTLSLRLDPTELPGKFKLESLAVRPAPRLALNWLRLRQVGASLACALRKPSAWRDNLRNLRKGYLSTRGFVPMPVQFDAERWIDPYRRWIATYDYCPKRDRNCLEVQLAGLRNTPLISVLMPVFNPSPDLLEKAIASVASQIYPHWELCIADDCSTMPALRKLLTGWAAREPRIKLVFRDKNGHISAATNSAFKLASGDWAALLDHDDVLPEHALAEVALAINRNPGAQLIYSDEDKLNEGGRTQPHFKPGFSIDLLRSMNYFNHLTVHRAANIRAAGGWREGYEGSQDYDLNLRIVEQIPPSAICHIPKVLYHWRMAPGSTAANSSEKSYAFWNGLQALNDHLVRCRLPAFAEPLPNIPYYRVRYSVPDPAPLVSIIVPTRDAVDLLELGLGSILQKTTYPNYEILIVDNRSEKNETFRFFRKITTAHSNVRVLAYDEAFNFSAMNNFAVSHARGNILVLLNNDIEVISPDWLDEMVAHAMRPEVGCVGAKLFYPEGSVQHGGVILGIGGVAGHAHKYFPQDADGYISRLKVQQNLSAVTAACLVVRKDVFLQVGGLEQENLRVAFNDVDFCLRVCAAGYLNVFTPFARLYHHESISRGLDNTPEKMERFNREVVYMRSRWGPLLDADPYYSPNLTLHTEDFALRT